MSPATALLERLAPVAEPGARARRGRDWLAAHGLPTGREEAWRYTPVADILAALDGAGPAPDPAAAPDGAVVDRAVVDDLAGDLGGPRLVFVNGALVPGLSDLDSAVAGLWLGGAEGLRPRRRPDAAPPADEPADGFHALNWAAGRDVAAVLAEPDARLDAPVHVVHLAAPGAGPSVSHPRTVVRVGRGARLDVVETFAGLPGAAVTNASTRIVAGPDSAVRYHRVLVEPPGTVHVGRTGIDQDARSTVRATSVVVGGDIVRNALDARIGGPDARAELTGLYLPGGRQRHDNVVTVDHAASRGTSTQLFKGIVAGHGRGSFCGHVLVRPGTAGTDARQSNPNLVLAPTAQADTRPWLEILADDVRCTHGATVGRLSADALFYLRSRGIPLAEARAVLVAGFAAEVIDALAPAPLRERIEVAFADFADGEVRR